jgi:hypothetical protein
MLYNINCNNYISVLDIQLWMMHCLLIYYRDHYAFYLSIKDAHDRQYNYMKITIFTLIRMIRLIGFNIQDKQIHVNIQFCNQ